MNLKPKSFPRAAKRYTLSALLAAVGVLLIWYGFELVSVPHVREHQELLYIAFGLLTLVAGGGYGVKGLRGLKRTQSDTPEGGSGSPQK